MILRKALWKAGLRYRLNSRGIPGRPDVIFPAQRVAVFCDGDFWHGRNWTSLRRKLSGGHNSDYWIAKIHANRERDRLVNARLADLAWTTVRVWETDVQADIDTVVRRVTEAVTRAKKGARKR